MDDHPNRLTSSIPRRLYTLQHLQVCFSTSIARSSPALCSTVYTKLAFMIPQVLLLDGNDLTGVIDEDVGNLKHLTYLDLSHNRLFGKLPAGLFECTKLVHLRLKNNYLSGKIVKNIGQLANVEILDLGDNAFEGLIPETAPCTAFDAVEVYI